MEPDLLVFKPGTFRIDAVCIFLHRVRGSARV